MPRHYRYITADVFTDRLFGGNPLAVFPDATGLSDVDMQRIAREFNLSETTFVLPPADPRHTCSMRIFTPGAELPFAGHPTVGTAIVLAERHLLPAGADRIVIEERVGPVSITVRPASASSAAFAEFTLPKLPERIGGLPPAPDLARMLGLDADAIPAGVTPAAYSAGVPYACVPLRDAAALAAARLNSGIWEELLARTATPHVFIFTAVDWQAGREIRARMFAPALGVSEDPATGSAVAAFAGFLADLQKPRDGRHAWLIRQGGEMGRPSRISLDCDFANGGLIAARIGGQAVIVSEGEFLFG